MSKSILDQLDEAEKAATADLVYGPSDLHGANGNYVVGPRPKGNDFHIKGNSFFLNRADAELLVLSRHNIRALIDVVKAAEYCLGVGPGILHGEECPGDPDYADEDFFGPCECGAEKWSNAISKLRTK